MVNLVDPKVTVDSGWESVSYGSTVVYNVEDSAGNPEGAAVVFFGPDSHHVWFDLENPLVKGQAYLATVVVKVGENGYTGTFDIAYYTDGDAVNQGEFNLSGDGWETIEYAFVAGDDSLNDPSLRLIGWGNGAAQEYLVIDSVTLEETDSVTDGDASTDEPVSDVSSHPYGTPTSFSSETVEDSGGRLVAYPEPTTMEDFSTVIKRDFGSFKEWGEEDTEIRPASESPFDERFLRTTMPAGTSSGSDVEGGTGWEADTLLGQGVTHAALRYRVRFQPGFDFVKGGKLPGLYGGDSPSGGAATDNGFTTRMMWRTDGQGELYAYMMNKTHSMGDSIGRGMFNFTPGIWHTIEQEVILNTVDSSNGDVYPDGVVRIWFDGQPIFEVTGMIFRDDLNVTIDGIMSTIFFGGSSEEWRTPVDQYIETGDFKIFTPRT